MKTPRFLPSDHSPRDPPSYVYILRLRSGALYIGVTRDRRRRWAEHTERHGSGRTTHRDPVRALVFIERHTTRTSALKRERQLKRWTRAKKEALVARDLEHLKHLSRRGRS